MDNLKQNIKIFDNQQKLFFQAAKDFSVQTQEKSQRKDFITVALAGGKTPESFFDTLAQDIFQNLIPWHKIKFFFGDERYVPKDDPRNNYFNALKHLFLKTPTPQANIYRIDTEFDDPQLSALDYKQKLMNLMDVTPQLTPIFDIFYLGLGADGHTASLLPFTETVKFYSDSANNTLENDPLAVSLWSLQHNMFRISLTPPVINQSKQIYFLVTGEDKADAVKMVLQGPFDPIRYPAQLIKSPSGKVIWYLDQAAARKLKL